MARRSWNPIGFTPLPVTILASAIYIALFTALLLTHHVLPSAPSSATPKAWPGVNTTQAWLDLQHLTKDHHPFITRSNVAVRQWLIARINAILDANGADGAAVSDASSDSGGAQERRSAVLFDDSTSNITYSFARDWITYFEGENIVVYIRGSEDEPGAWWEAGSNSGFAKGHERQGGVLVNAHFDSVSTGFGATDDGVGVVTVLQLISHFTTQGHQPKKGILALLNNGEEDGLYGAKAFTQDPISRFPHAFLNLEGAGAGGRATLFRSTDAEVTRFYARSSHPFGSIVSGDGFKRGVVRSGTDYTVFTEDLGMRGLDVAFMAPRARYHTSQDDARDSSIESLWHMLSASLATVKALSDDTSSTFQKTRGDSYGKRSDGVWFDILGRAFAVLQLHTLFALSVTFLVAGPILLLVLEICIRKLDKWYPFSRKTYLRSADDDEPIRLYGWRGFFRFPIVFLVATAAVVALAFLFTKVGPLIIYSSPYAVWTCMLAAWLSVAWFFLRLAESIRPTALVRLYTLIWIYVLSWAALVAVTVSEHRLHLGSGYFVVIYNAAAFAALLISYLELLALPKKSKYAQHAYQGLDITAPPTRAGSVYSSNMLNADDGTDNSEAPLSNGDENDGATERTSLLPRSRRTFARYGRGRRRSEQSGDLMSLVDDPLLTKAYEGEQAWSSSLPRWTWLLQLLVLAPINVILVGQIGLLATTALHQTPADGNSVFTIYMLIACLSVLLLLPISPFLHRMTYHIPTFLFLVFVGTLLYNILAFPFSRENRLKVYFFSQIDLNTGHHHVALTGLQPYTSEIVSQLPSAAGSNISCGHVDWATRTGLESCVWTGLAPHVVPASYTPGSDVPRGNTTITSSDLNSLQSGVSAANYTNWIGLNITRPARNDNGTEKRGSNDYTFDIQGVNTRACRLYLDTSITNLTIEGAGPSGQGYVPAEGSAAAGNVTQIRLWSREWDGKWRITVTLPSSSSSSLSPSAGNGNGNEMVHTTISQGRGIKGRVTCLWADVNQVGTIPAFDEVKAYMPVWSAVTKGSDGLVEGFKGFEL